MSESGGKKLGLVSRLSMRWQNFRARIYRLLLDRNWDDDQAQRVVRTNDSGFNGNFKNYCDNTIKTSRYTWLTFIPLNLFEQFLRAANCYFLVLVILQSIPTISPLPNTAQGVGLAAVILLTSIKYGIEDILRHRSDKRINGRGATVISSFNFETTVKWQEIKVGQIVSLKKDEPVPADLILLSSSEGTGLCYIETAELDGETNLKYRLSLEKTQKQLGNDLTKLGSFNGEIQCEAPNPFLTRFEGCLVWQGEKLALTNDNLLLRGCTVRNTHWAYGVVIYAGRQTKLMKNSGKTVIKRTKVDRLSNTFLLSTFVLMLTLMIISAIMGYLFESGIGRSFKDSYSLWMTFVGGADTTPALIAVVQMFSHLILIQQLVPITIYVSLEGLQFLLSRLYMNSDIGMYHEETDTPAQARTTTLNEDLGQIEYVFSDKTGTLTRNVMTFNKCSVGGRKYGEDNGEGVVDFSKHEPSYWEPSFRFLDKTLLDEVQNNTATVHEFFLLLALCHTVNAEIDDNTGKMTYNSQSPDETALAGAARNFGFVFKNRTQSSITVQILGVDVTYDLLCLLDFDTVRKRMSIIIFDKQSGRRRLFCKGADSSIFPLIPRASRSTMVEATRGHLDEFAREGLRTLCCAARDIPDPEWTSWLGRYKEASTTLENRAEKLAQCFSDIERDLSLIGATAVEDKLQDGVPETIFKLGLAGIKVWVLTGDKQETAINIGYLCNILTNDTRQLIVDGEEYFEVEQQLVVAREQLEDDHSVGQQVNVAYTYTNDSSVAINLEPVGNHRSSVLIINGHSLYHALNEKIEDLFLDVACNCHAVICCRLAPLQKGRVVDLVKRKKEGLTLAIGDGANDVNMIKTAHIGVGISGQEGRQAVLSSDFAFAQFRFLQRLLLIHGRHSYYRISGFFLLFFYKTFAYAICQFWFAIYCGWSAMSVYDQWFISTYQFLYSATPVLYYAIFEKDVKDEYSLKFPNLYRTGLTSGCFNWRTFILTQVEGFLTSAVTFFLVRFGFSESFTANGYDITASKAALGIAVGTSVVFVVTVRCSAAISYWTKFNWTPVISISTVFLFQFLYSVIMPGANNEFENFGVLEAVWGSPTFWLCTFAAIAICILPFLAFRLIFFIFKPSLLNRVKILRLVEDEHAWLHWFWKWLSKM